MARKAKAKAKKPKHALAPAIPDRDVTYTEGLRVVQAFVYADLRFMLPGILAVLDCLASDSATVENARSFEEWCGDLGYDTDSRRAERTWKACVSTARRLKQFLGDDLFRELLQEVERV